MEVAGTMSIEMPLFFFQQLTLFFSPPRWQCFALTGVSVREYDSVLFAVAVKTDASEQARQVHTGSLSALLRMGRLYVLYFHHVA